MHPWILLAGVSLSSVAVAQTPEPQPPPAEATATAATPKDAPREGRFEIGFRGRMMSLPGAVLDFWYEKESSAAWPVQNQTRPRITAYVGGLEFIYKKDTSNTIFYVEYAKSLMKEGYFDSNDGDPFSGEYVRPSSNLGLVNLGANYGYEAHIIQSARTHGRFGLSFIVGGGLGVAIRTGKVERWIQDEENGTPAYILVERGQPSDGEKSEAPPIVSPLVDINASLRLTLGDRVSIRFEGGLHSLLYYGTSVGLIF